MPRAESGRADSQESRQRDSQNLQGDQPDRGGDRMRRRMLGVTTWLVKRFRAGHVRRSTLTPASSCNRPTRLASSPSLQRVKTGKSRSEKMYSGLPPRADIDWPLAAAL